MSNVVSTSVPVNDRRRADTRGRAADIIPSSSLDSSLARRASAFLLDLYAMSRTHPLDRFQQATLSRLRSELPFCSAYWGMLHAQPDGPLTLHNAFVDTLPDEFVHQWETVKHKDELAARVVARPGVASTIRTADMNDHEFLIMGERFGIGSATSIAVVAPVPKLLTFLSLYRPADAPPFEHDDRCFQEIIMPHVAAAWHANWLHHFEGMHAGCDGPRKSFAVADRHGVLHVSDATFSVLMRSEWPGWSGPELPVALCDSIARDCDYDGSRLGVAVRRQNDLTLLQVRARSALDRLSPREAEIVEWYREGLSYKQIATRLGCSPYTIRHHLREIYSKLGVCNKVALIRLAGDTRAQRS
jgi:RNA polymerase sigma factor (sigma-70 family)